MKKILIFLLFSFILVGCGLNDKKEPEEIPTTIIETPTKTVEEKTTIIEEKEEIPEGQKISKLTGLYVDEEIANKRPLGIVFNNLPKAVPQSGISKGDIFYEVVAEGGITRIIALVENNTSERIGSIRSGRLYFIDFILDNNGIFVHHGGSPETYKFISENTIDDLDGIYLEGVTFYRDQVKWQKAGKEHSSYTNNTLLEEALIKKKIERNYNDDQKGMLNFHEKETEIKNPSGKALKIKIPYSQIQTTEFVYNSNKKIYEKFQNNEKHIDEETDTQLEVKNILIQNVNARVVDNVGRMDVDIIGSGQGFYFSNGNYEKIKWEKENHYSQTKWFFENGDELKINPGKTWICVFQNIEDLEIYEKIEE